MRDLYNECMLVLYDIVCDTFIMSICEICISIYEICIMNVCETCMGVCETCIMNVCETCMSV